MCTMNETFVKLSRRVSTGQRPMLAEAWLTLGPLMTDADKRRWFTIPDDEGFNRLAKIAMGDGKAVIEEAKTRMLVTS